MTREEQTTSAALMRVVAKATVWSSVIVTLCCPAAPRAESPDMDKKLIQFGWGVPDPQELVQHIRWMERVPVDGLVFRMKGHLPDGSSATGHYAFRPERIQESWYEKDYDNLRRVRFERFTDNFIAVDCSPATLDWFDDSHWDAVWHNVRLILKGALIAKCKGIMFDPEVYELRGAKGELWRPPELQADPSLYGRYAAQARIRGRQFMETVADQMPRATVLCLIQASYVAKDIDSSNSNRRQALAQHGYALLPAFLDGMLDGIRPGMSIVDGNENAYKYTSNQEFDLARRRIREDTLHLIAPENRDKYKHYVQVGSCTFIDMTFTGRRTFAEEASQFEANVYDALRTSDRYVWQWGEAWRWWPPRERRIPRGAREAILNARDRVAGIDDAERLRDLFQAEIPSSDLSLPSAVVTPVPVDRPAPLIDGHLNDPAWRDAQSVGPFRTRAILGEPTGRTQAWVTFDMEHLYVAFDCREPSPEGPKGHGLDRDRSIHSGDAVYCLISRGAEPMPFGNFAVNPDNVQWDAWTNMEWGRLPEDDAAYDARWRSAVGRDSDGWTVELAIPWRELNIRAPVDGQVLRANLGRKRWHDGWELISWAPVMKASGFDYQVEPYHFGYLVFVGSTATTAFERSVR